MAGILPSVGAAMVCWVNVSCNAAWPSAPAGTRSFGDLLEEDARHVPGREVGRQAYAGDALGQGQPSCVPVSVVVVPEWRAARWASTSAASGPYLSSGLSMSNPKLVRPPTAYVKALCASTTGLA